MNKYKFKLKGKDMVFSTYAKGDMQYIIASIMQFVCNVSIANDINKKQFLEQCKSSYEQVMKMINEEGRN